IPTPTTGPGGVSAHWFTFLVPLLPLTGESAHWFTFSVHSCRLMVSARKY
ncbi:hypothetical protein RRG08_064914, partial [Elysia crispata]